MPSHPLPNFETQKCYENKPIFNRAFSRDNMSNKINDGTYITNLDEYADLGTYWIALFCNRKVNCS